MMPTPISTAGAALQNLGKFDQALASFDRAIALNPGYAEAYSNRGVALQDMNRSRRGNGRFRQSNRAATSGILRKPAAILAYCLLKMEPIRTRLAAARVAQEVTETGWQSHLGGAALAWSREYSECDRIRSFRTRPGRYDSIQPLRQAAKRGRGAKVVISVQEPLYPLLKQMSPDIRVIKGSEVPSQFDYHCPLMSLPLAFGTTLQTIPCERRLHRRG